MESVSIQTLDSFAALRNLAPELGSSQSGAEYFCTIEWFETLAQHGLDPAGKLRLLLAEDSRTGTRLCLPLVEGKTLTSMSNYYSSLYGPIGDIREVPFETWRALCRHIRRDASRWPIIDLQPLDASTPFCRDMIAALRAEGYSVDTYYRFGNWYLDVSGRSFDAYRGTLPSRLLHTIERGRRKLDREGDWNLTIHKHPEEDLEQAIADFERVYRQSWKQPEPHPDFIPNLCRAAAARGWLRLGIARLRGAPIAAQLWLVKDGKALIYKLAYDEAQSRFSPGSILSAALMQHAIDVDHVHEVDYLTGDDAYKRDWMSHRRERVGIVAFNLKTIRGLAAAGNHFLRKSIKRFRTTRNVPIPP